jgi:hypothetical protein
MPFAAALATALAAAVSRAIPCRDTLSRAAALTKEEGTPEKKSRSERSRIGEQKKEKATKEVRVATLRRAQPSSPQGCVRYLVEERILGDGEA